MSQLDLMLQFSHPGCPSESCGLPNNSLTSKQVISIYNLKPATRKEFCQNFHFFQELIPKEWGENRHHALFQISLHLFSFITNSLFMCCSPWDLHFCLVAASQGTHLNSGSLIISPDADGFQSDSRYVQTSFLSKGLL